MEEANMRSTVFLGEHSLDPLRTVQLLASLTLQVHGDFEVSSCCDPGIVTAA